MVIVERGINVSFFEEETLIVANHEVGERLDKLLANRFAPRYSRAYFQYLIDTQLILLNGQPVKKRIKPNLHDEIEIQFAALPQIELIPQDIPLSILYEDDDLLVVDKQAGLVVHPAPGHWSGTFVNALIHHCSGLKNNTNDIRPGIVHRLDKDTSGVLIAAKTALMQQKLVNLFATRQVYKEYLAVCVGRPLDGQICAPIGRHPVHRTQMAVVENGREAISDCKVLHYDNQLSLVKIVILTGRTHQIRVHLKHKGAPVLGDQLYGYQQANNNFKAQRPLLLSASIRLHHPFTNQLLEFKAQPPADMLPYIKQLTK